MGSVTCDPCLSKLRQLFDHVVQVRLRNVAARCFGENSCNSECCLHGICDTHKDTVQVHVTPPSITCTTNGNETPMMKPNTPTPTVSTEEGSPRTQKEQVSEPVPEKTISADKSYCPRDGVPEPRPTGDEDSGEEASTERQHSPSVRTESGTVDTAMSRSYSV